MPSAFVDTVRFEGITLNDGEYANITAQGRLSTNDAAIVANNVQTPFSIFETGIVNNGEIFSLQWNVLIETDTSQVSVTNNGRMSAPRSDSMLIYGFAPSIVNNGIISSGETAIRLQPSSDSGQISNTGSISSNSSSAVFILGGGHYIENSGEISGAINISGGTSLNVNNSGTIATRDLTVFSDAGASTDTITNTGTIIGFVSLGGGADRLDSSGGVVAGDVRGGTGADTLIGGINDDRFFGEADSDILRGNGGNDLLDGGTGIDIMDGGEGSDTYVVDNGADEVNEASDEGRDTVQTSLSYELDDNLEALTLLGSTAISGTGNEVGNRLEGNTGVNTLSGQEGRDRLDGKAGNDTLLGGTGKDTFLFTTALNATTNVDTIRDYIAADDTIKLENGVFTALTVTGTLAAGALADWDAADQADDRVIYQYVDSADADTAKDTIHLYYDPNGGSTADAVRFATLTNQATITLTADDFRIM